MKLITTLAVVLAAIVLLVIAPAGSHTPAADANAEVVGVWTLSPPHDAPVTVLFEDIDGRLTGTWYGADANAELTEVRYERGRLRFRLEPDRRDGPSGQFDGRVADAALRGSLSGSHGRVVLAGERLGAMVTVVETAAD